MAAGMRYCMGAPPHLIPSQVCLPGDGIGGTRVIDVPPSGICTFYDSGGGESLALLLRLGFTYIYWYEPPFTE